MRQRIKARLRRLELSSLPNHALLHVVNIPEGVRSHPFFLILRRFLLAATFVFLVAVVVFLGRNGYNEDLTFPDAIYYSAVSLTTTGYGDIVPVTPMARMINVILITPVRIAFLILLVGTTLSVLTEKSRKAFQIQQWRKHVRDHTIIIGFGTKGHSAAQALLDDGADPREIVVVDTDQHRLFVAEQQHLVTINGSGTKSDVLNVAGIQTAANVVVTTNSDDTNVLATLSARELNKDAHISSAVREVENRHLLLQSGANSTIVSSETAGRLLGLSTVTPAVVKMINDLLSPSAGFTIAERPVASYEVGVNPRHLSDIVLSVIRGGRVYRVDMEETLELRDKDRLLYIRNCDDEDRKKMDERRDRQRRQEKATGGAKNSAPKTNDQEDNVDSHGTYVDEQKDRED